MTLLELMQRHGLTQVAIATGTGLPQSAISDIAAKKRRPRTDTVNRILAFARLYEPSVTYEDLFGEPDLPRPVVGNAA